MSWQFDPNAPQIPAKIAENAAASLDIPAEWLLWIFDHESNYNWQSYVNQGGFYTAGLIQFTSSTMAGMQIDVNRLLSDPDYQEAEIIRYYQNWFSAIKKPENAYEFVLMNFYPAAVNKPLSWEFPPATVQRNPGLFVFGKTKADYFKYLEQYFPKTEVFSLDYGKKKPLA